MKLRSIPQVPSGADQRTDFDRALRENLQQITGRRGDPIAPLNADTATTAQIAAKINEILLQLQGR
jgi:hypothetical protein